MNITESNAKVQKFYDIPEFEGYYQNKLKQYV